MSRANILDAISDPAAFRDRITINTPAGPRKLSAAIVAGQVSRFKILDQIGLYMIGRGPRPAIVKALLEGVRGCGKTLQFTIFAMHILCCCTRRILMEAAATDSDQAAGVIRIAKMIVSLNPWLSQFITIRVNSIVNTKTGAELRILTSDLASSFGTAPDLLFVDEMSQFEGTSWLFLQGLLDSAVKTGCPVILCSNAGNISSEPYTLREYIRISVGQWFHHVFNTIPPWIKPADVEEAKARSSPSWFAKYWLCIWSDAVENPLLSRPLIRSCESTSTLWDDSGKPAKPRSLHIGIDVGRTRDRSVIWVLEKLGDVAWTREIHVMANMSFRDQKEEIVRRITPDVATVRIDKGAIGYQLAEELTEEYPRVCVGVQLTQGVQGVMGLALKEAFEAARIRIPRDPELAADLLLVSEVETSSAGVPILKTNRGPTGHADRFWAAALALSGVPHSKPARQGPPPMPRYYRSKYSLDSYSPSQEILNRYDPVSWKPLY